MSSIVLAVLAITALLALVSFLLPLANRLKLPFSVLLAALGMGLGLASLAMRGDAPAGPLTDLLRGLGGIRIDATTFLYLFMPPLLFAGGLSNDVRRLFDEFASILVLAVVAVLICTLFVGFALHWSFGVPLVASLLLGAVVAATDPSAVVAVFRDLGAPRRLSILVEGESLFNDAAAIALFSIFVAVLSGDGETGLASGLLLFTKGILGGILVGYLMARATCAAVILLREHPVAEITLTVSLAYLSYVVAEVYFGVSGVVAVVTAALVVGSLGRTRISATAWESLTVTWAQLNFWASSLIFILAAMLVPRMLGQLLWSDAAMLAVVLLAALAARAAVVYGLFPGLSLLGLADRVDSAQRLVILWGGLRGAVTLALALAVIENPAVPVAVERVVAPLATGFVLFTLFVNGPTLRPLLRLLGLDRLSPTEAALRDRVLALSRRNIEEQVADVAREYGIDQDLVCRVPAPPGAAGDDTVPDDKLSDQDRLQIGLTALANREEELYLRHLKERTVSSRLASLAVVQAGRMLDGIKTAGLAGYQAAAKGEVALDWRSRVALWLHRVLGWSGPLAGRLADRFEVLLLRQVVLRELGGFNRQSVAPLLGQKVCGELQTLIEERLEANIRAVAALELQYPAYAESLRVRFLGRSALRLEESEYRLMRRESLVSQELYSDLLRDLRARRQAFQRRPPLDLGMELKEMIQRVPIFESLPDDRLTAVAGFLRPRMAVPGERVVSAGARGDAMYFIAAGEVEVSLKPEAVPLTTGDFFGELALLTHRRRMADVTAKGFCHLLVLDGRDFRKLVRAFPELKERIGEVADARLKEQAEASG